MTAVLRFVLLAGTSVALVGCGDLYRRNELFSSRVKQPEVSTVSVASVPAPQTEAALDQGFDERHVPAASAQQVQTASRTTATRPVRTASTGTTKHEAAPGSLARHQAIATARPRQATNRDQVAVATREPAEPAVALATPGGSSDARRGVVANETAVRPTPGDQVLAGLLRVWNKVAVAELSSKVLFNVWPEDVDGKPPTDRELSKRGAAETR